MRVRSVVLFLCLVLTGQAVASDSLYDYIKSHTDPATGTLRPEANVLPDEPPGRRYSRLRWVSGALEGLGTRHMKWDGSEKASNTVRLLEAVATGNIPAEATLYEMLRTDDVVTFYNDALDLAAERIRDPEALHEMARRFATQSADRGPVKFGIAMLGSFGDERDLTIVQTLALHDEFGLYAAEAIAELAPDRQHALYDMARRLDGWGRIEAISRMVATHDPVLRWWLLTEGFRNTVTPQYLAYQCVTIADLAGALEDLEPNAKSDLPLLIGAADLLDALIKPGPAAGLDKYEDAPRAATAFLRNIQKRRDSVSFYIAAVALRDYMAALPARSADDTTDVAVWQPEQQREVTALATRIAGDSSWRRRVVAAINAEDTDLDQAEAAATKLGIKTFNLHMRRLTQRSVNPRRWELAFAGAEPDDVKRLIEIAQSTFASRFANPHTRHATNTALSQNAHELQAGGALEAVLHGIARYPGSGMSLIESSLADADERVRRAAVETLVRWGGPYLRNVSVRAALTSAANDESDEALKARMVALLNLGMLP
jgi:hypothetical protein